MDFSSFFPSLTSFDVEILLREASSKGLLGETWGTADSALLISLVCRLNELPMGAPTSPKISNALCFDLDLALTTLATKNDVIYTRYADDLFFSTTKRGVLRGIEADVTDIVSTLRHPRGLSLNLQKTRHSSKKRRRVVTGLVLTTDQHLSLGRARKRQLRSLVYKYTALDSAKREALRGWLSYARSVEPEFLNSLVLKFGADYLTEVLSPKIAS
jgi:RNA-directed DNA polymerase